MKVVQGPNIWRLVRTDKDAANMGEVLDTLGPAMAFFLGPIQPDLGGTIQGAVETKRGERDSVDGWEWRIGAARPVVALRVAHDEAPLPKGRVLGSRSDPDVLPTVDAESPWFVDVLFFWRAQSSELDYPALTGSILGTRSREPGPELDWYLDRAIEPEKKPEDPGDASWSDAQAGNLEDFEEAAKQVGAALLPAGLGLALLAGVLWLMSKRS